jgi:carbamoyltransferase
VKILGLWSGHDCSFCVLEDGVPKIHAELERYIREKEPKGDSIDFALRVLGNFDDIDAVASCHPAFLLGDTSRLGNRPLHIFSHHQAHAAHAFYSSKFQKAIVLTIDGGGIENAQGTETATTIWRANGTGLYHVKTFSPHKINVGGLWTRVTRYVFKLQNGWPLGHQAGTVMAMAALGNPQRFYLDFKNMLTQDLLAASAKPADQPKGAYVPGKDPIHPYLDRWAQIADKSEQDKFDLAAGLQAATEYVVHDLIETAIQGEPGEVDLCIAGGVALNSVMIGKIVERMRGRVRRVYVPPVPYDGGLSLGAAQHLWHHNFGKPRIDWQDNLSPFLGEKHGNVRSSLESYSEQVVWRESNDDEVVDLLAGGSIVAVFNEGSESGRRALGNRSILADPRDPGMKAKINDKVKHRVWYRPYAPSILRDEVENWFMEDVDSPYMTHVVKFKPEMAVKVPAVVHFDGSARLQTVTRNDNPWYWGLINKFYAQTGIPILLDTSYNDNCPIVESPKDALDCYLGTEIDYVYFVADKLLVMRKQ